MKFRWGDQQKVTFLVSDQIEEIMLGMEFLTESKCQVDFVTSEVRIGQRKISSAKYDEALQCRRTRIKQMEGHEVEEERVQTKSGVNKSVSYNPEVAPTSDQRRIILRIRIVGTIILIRISIND